MKRKVNKGAKRRMFLWFSIFVLLISYMSYTTITYWKEIMKNKTELIVVASLSAAILSLIFIILFIMVYR